MKTRVSFDRLREMFTVLSNLTEVMVEKNDERLNRNDEPLVLSTCDLAARPFQKWEFAGNGSSLVNSDTHKCLTKGAGGEQPAGKGDDDGGGLKLEIQKCLGAGDWHERQQHWSWVPIREYPGYHLDGRTFD